MQSTQASACPCGCHASTAALLTGKMELLRKHVQVGLSFATGFRLCPQNTSAADDKWPQTSPTWLSLAGCSQQGGCHGGPAARLFACTSRGVDRVFVDHPLYAELPSFNGTYTYTDAGSAPDLDLAHSVLCQAALAAPALLWHATADQQAHVMEQTLPQSLVGGIAHVAGQQRHPEAEALWQQVPRQQQGPSQRQGPSQQQVLPATTSNFIGSPERLVFVANDWPTAPLLLRLKHCCQSRQSRPPEEVDMVAAPPIPRLEHSLDRMNSQQPPSVLCPPSLPLQQPETADQLPFVYRPSLSDSKYLAELEHHIASQLSGARAVYCIHNLAYQGLFDRVSR